MQPTQHTQFMAAPFLPPVGSAGRCPNGAEMKETLKTESPRPPFAPSLSYANVELPSAVVRSRAWLPESASGDKPISKVSDHSYQYYWNTSRIDEKRNPPTSMKQVDRRDPQAGGH
jgi:hypothetical protein